MDSPDLKRRELGRIALLLVHPEADERHTTAGLLRGLAVSQTQTARSGAEALVAMRLRLPDLVLAEWDMPGMSGLELLQAMRAEPALAGVPLVLMLTTVDRTLVAAAVQGGVSDLIVKPYTLARLEDKILGAVRRGVPSGAATAQEARDSASSPTPAPRARQTILAVDDTPDNLRLMADLFAEDYRVRVADNGEKALALCTGPTPPDLLLLDVMMPGMDGFEVAQRLRAQPQGELLPIVFVTALDDDASRTRGFNLGAVDFVSKPIEPELLRLRVRNLMRYVELHQRLQQEFDAMLAEGRRKQAQAQRLQEDVTTPLERARQRLAQCRGLEADALAEVDAGIALALAAVARSRNE